VIKKSAPVGRPSEFLPEYVDQAAKLCRLGAINADLADFFDVSEVTINAWKKAHPEFLKSINDAKSEADALVERSLYQRAIGYSHDAVKIFNNNGAALVVPYVEHYPPSDVACMFWLKNRRKEDWKDKHEVEHKTDPNAPPVFTLNIDNS
jgi:hypothetical protein